MTDDKSPRGVSAANESAAQLNAFSETLIVPAGHGEAEKSPPPTDIGQRVRDRAGVTLDDLLQRKSLPWRQAMEVVAAVADTLAAVHGRGAAHGRLCPELIVYPNNGQPALADLGIGDTGRAGRDDESPAEVIGPCSAPEQVQAGGMPIDPRCDVYSLGVILYRMLCSRYPFRATDREELRREIVEDAPQPPRQLTHGIPPQLEQLCMRLLAKEPLARPANGEELARELRRVLDETESSDRSAESMAGSGVVRRPAAAMCDNELLLVFTWDLSMMSTSQVGMVTEELRHLLGDYVTRCQGSVLSQSESATVVRLPRINELAAGLPTLLGHALMFLSEIMWKGFTVGFEIGSAETGESNSVDQPASHLSGLKRVASRMQGRVAKSGVEISPATMELLRRWLPCRPMTDDVFEVTVAGPDAPISAATLARVTEPWQAEGGGLRSITVRLVVGAADTTPLPLIGRASQLAMLKARWEQACEGMGQIVLLIGDEGVGKTRLLQELSRVVQESPSPSHWIRWSCRPGMSGQSLHPAADFFQNACQLSPDTDSVEQLSAYLNQWKLATPETLSTFASLLQFPIVGLSDDVRQRQEESQRLTAAQRRARWQQALLEWLKQVAAASPVVFVVEDLQWVDPATQALLHTLVDQGLNEHLMTILTFRPEFETPWGSRAHQTQVALSRLTKRNATSVFSAITGVTEPSQSLIDQLLSVSEGIPLFVEEFARSHQRAGRPFT